MSLSVSARMARVRPSPTSAVVSLVAELRAQGKDIVSLGAGEPDFDTPAFVKAAAVDAIDAGETKYTPIDGTAELKGAIRRKFRRDNDLSFETEQILVSCGAKQAIFNLCLALLDAHDEVIIPAPYWVSYPDMVRLADAAPVIVDAGIDEGFKISPSMLESAMTDSTRLLILNSPSNPTGASYTQAELRALGDVLQRYPRVVVIADDIYEHIYWGEEPFVSFGAACPELLPRTVTTNGVSKAYAMTGWRIGWAAGPAELITAMKTIQSQSTSNPCSVSQAAAVAALDGDQQPVTQMCRAYRERHDFIVTALDALPGFECRHGSGTFYAFPRVTGAIEALGMADDTALVQHLIAEGGVASVPGSAFGAPGHIRFSYACSLDVLEDAIGRMRRALSA